MKYSLSFSTIGALFLVLCATSFAVSTNEPATSPKDTYPLSQCVVSGDKLGQMEPPTIIDYQGTEVRFCCKDCVKDFQKDPEKYMKRLHEATASQKDKNPPLPAASPSKKS